MSDRQKQNLIQTETATGSIVQVAGSVYGDISIGPASDDPNHDLAGWGALVSAARVWKHVPVDRDPDRVRTQAVEAAIKLSTLQDQLVDTLRVDPWYDPGFVIRFFEHVDWLAGEPSDVDLDLYPIEAAFLVLIPLIYLIHYSQMVALLSFVEPWNLAPAARPNTKRAEFESFAEQYGILCRRSRAQQSAGESIGWWIFHRWLLQYNFADEDQIASLCNHFSGELAGVFTAVRVSRTLRGLRRGPSLCGAEYISVLPVDDQVSRTRNQRIREQRLSLILALAYNVSIEKHTLPDIVAEHLGIPDPVDLAQLDSTLNKAVWGGSHHVPILRAQCQHAAVIEGLREHVRRTDELLHAVHQTVRERITYPMPTLPARLSADDVTPSEGSFSAWAQFRVDGPAVRELLMGETLYKDRDLAIRELYQNSIDACRHRKARTEYLQRTGAQIFDYQGIISVEQGVDSDGRLYVECRDNGIGMGHHELRGVFTKAGERFAEQPDFMQEQVAWQRLDPPVEMFPNSRFGIGVLSYFMLADEIKVTTCRMKLDGTLGPQLQASIFGPGHLFRISQSSPRGDDCGTVVRLYIKEATTASRWSAVSILERLLGIAEFETIATHGGARATWRPGCVKPRQGNSEERIGFAASGTLVDWSDAPPGVNITWCAKGGGLLVDGLVVQPEIRMGVLSNSPMGLVGVIVNLSGRYSPARLSVDRRYVLDDLSDMLEPLLEEAFSAFLGTKNELLCFEWLSAIASYSTRLAEILAIEAAKANYELKCGREYIDVNRIGFLPADQYIVGIKSDKRETYGVVGSSPNIDVSWFSVPNNVYLWRLIAYNHRDLAQFRRICPELQDVSPFDVLPARPVHQEILQKSSPSNLAEVSRRVKLTVGATLSELAEFGIKCVKIQESDNVSAVSPEFSALRGEGDRLLVAGERATVTGVLRAANMTGVAVSEIIDLWRRIDVQVSREVGVIALAAQEDHLLVLDPDVAQADYRVWIEPGHDVPPGHIVRSSIDLDVPVSEICERLRDYGLEANSRNLPDRPTSELATLLSLNGNARYPWLLRGSLVPPACILNCASIFEVSNDEIIRSFSGLGFQTSFIPPDAGDADIDVLWEDYEDPLVPPGPVMYNHLLSIKDYPLHRVVARLNDYGFKVPIRFPAHFDSLDKDLFDLGGPVNWFSEAVGEKLPFANAILAASRFNIDPKDVASRLVKYGIRMSARTMPRGLSFSAALQIMDFCREDDDFYNFHTKPTLYELSKMSRRVGVPILRLHSWLTALGLAIPDLHNAICLALDGIPRASKSGDSD